MKILGILLILVALGGGWFLLSPTIQEYVNHGRVVELQEAEGQKTLRDIEAAKRAAPSPGGDERLLGMARSLDENARIIDQAKRIRADKVKEGGIMLAIAVALLAGGVWLIRRGGRRAELARSA